jgi:hypothetical protein
MADPARPLADAAGSISDRELRACTVRVDIRGTPKGSGFMVLPGQVVTCAHVLGAAAPAVATDIEVVDVDGTRDGVEAVADLWVDDDLAVLRVASGMRRPCVLLIEGQRVLDQFVTFGYPERRPEGVPRVLRADGATGTDRLLSLSEGQVQPGMSGAPLLNLRTGGVCGVLSLTRNPQLDLGGYAIPIELLRNLSPTLVRENRSYHAARRSEWFNLLTAPQRTVLRSELPEAPADDAFTKIFVVSVGGERNDWEVSATLYPIGKPSPKDEPEQPPPDPEQLPPAPEEVNLNVVRDKVARLFRDWAARGHAGPGAVPARRVDPGEDIRLLGGILFSAVLPGEVGERFRSMLPQVDERLLLALHFGPQLPRVFVEMPWEHLHVSRPDVRGDVHVARAERMAFVRVLEPEPRQPERPPRRELSVLMVGVTPPGEARDSPAQRIVENAARLIDGLAGVQIDRSWMQPPDAVRAQVQNGAYDIVHYVGFGQYLRGADQLALAGAPDYEFQDAEMFAAELSRQRPRVVVLQQIEGPKDVVPADLSVFAWGLLNQGVDAVVAYQFPLPPWLSVEFNREFYGRLAAGQSFEMAVQNARFELWMKRQDLHAFLSPAAFVRRPGELRLTAPGPPEPPIARVGTFAGHA